MLRLPYGVLYFLLEEPTMHIIVFYSERLPTTRHAGWSVGVPPSVCAHQGCSHAAAVTDKAPSSLHERNGGSNKEKKKQKKQKVCSAPSRLSTHNSCPVPEAQTSNFQMPTQWGVIATISPVKNVRWMVIFCFMISQEWWPHRVGEILCPSLISGA